MDGWNGWTGREAKEGGVIRLETRETLGGGFPPVRPHYIVIGHLTIEELNCQIV